MNRSRLSYRFSITAADVVTTTAALHKRVRFTITMLALFMIASPAIAAQKLETTVVQNCSTYGPAELFDVYKNYMGEPVSDATAKSIAEDLRRKYLDDGFAEPGYRISDNGLQSGIVRLELIEASISRVEFSGDPGPYRQKLEQMFGTLPTGQLLRPGEIRDLLRRARRLPGLDVGVTTRADIAKSGRLVLEVDSTYKLVEGNIKLSNRGTAEIGRNLAFVRIVANGLFGGENSGGLFLSTAKNSNAYSGGGLFANSTFGTRGTAARFQGSVTSLEVITEGVLLEQDRERYILKLTHPLIRRPDFELSAWGGLDIDNLDVFQDGVASRDDRLRSLESGLTMKRRKDDTLSLLNFDLERGLNGLGSRLDNYLDPDDLRQRDFTIMRLHYVRLTRLSDYWSLRWDGIAQRSAQVLPSIKRFKVGGNRIGRGFEAAAVSGDSGVGTKVELKRRIASELSLLGFVDLYGFYDFGAAWRNDLNDRESASSAGFGLSTRGDRLSAYLEVAKPLTHADADGRQEIGIFAEISMQF